MRARYPDSEGYVERDGVNIFYEVYENDGPTVFLVPTWCIFHSRAWKMQIPYLSRHFRVVTYDPRGNGRSGRPLGRESYSWQDNVGDLLAVLDATDTDQAVLIGVSISGYWSNITSVLHPERVAGVVSINAGTGLGIMPKDRPVYSYTDELDTTEGWAKENVHYIRRDYQGYVEFFVSQIFTEPHSTKQIEDGVRWALETDAETLIASDLAEVVVQEDMAEFYRRTARPLMVLVGDRDQIVAPESGHALAELTDGTLVVLRDSGHFPNMRDPVRVNLLIREFVERVAGSPGVAA
jgi:pimeloyl-ACP methyl ester carboxylesterase